MANLVRYSRDGDQFHYLWTSRRCLQLLSVQSDLVAISIEGPSPDEHAGNTATSAGEDVIDIAEYFGSEDIHQARVVRYMQLKHSTLHENEVWTASGLETTIEGFAQRYQEFLQTFTAEALEAKIQFWFVTNRPISKKFSEAVADAAGGFVPRHRNELKKLERFTGFSGSKLVSFLKLLRFEDRQDDYWEQRNILFQDVNGYLPDADVDGPLKLKELVTRRALSEGEKKPTITKMDVLRALDTDESRLFPAPCRIKSLNVVIPRMQEQSLIRAIIDAPAPIIVHASAGVGKTIFSTRIADALPIGSTGILYDCFGNGQYRNASGYRHRHKDALVQIANELAAKGLCHLLIPTTSADATSFVQAFINRIGQAAALVRLGSPSALLCIVIDAADNAQMAAEEIGEARSFVQDLIREKMPDNVRMVFVCRSHRQKYLDPPTESVRLELKPFSHEETTAHLRQRFAEASKYDIDEFHRLSSQNPRVQALALSRNNSLHETLRLLGPNPTSVEDTIGSLLAGAVAKLKDSTGPVGKSQVDKICAGLAALRPLIPIPVLSQMSGVDKEEIKSFAIDIGRPLLLAGDTIQFFDEPAETWFREKFKPSTEAMDLFIRSLLPLAKTSAYVASVLPQLMLEAGKFSELVELALNSAALPETSPLEKRDIELQRLQFALKAGLRSKRYLESAKLALKAGGETAGEDRQRKILQENTDLAAVFLETNLIEEIVSRRIFGSGWTGSHHAYEASLFSGCKDLVGDARSRLRMAHEWLDNWTRLTDLERKDEEISDRDIVELTIAQINIYNPANGANSLRGWRPREVTFRVGRSVVRRLIDHGRLQDVQALAIASGCNLGLLLAVTVELREIDSIPPIEATRRAFRLLARKRISLKDGQSWDDRQIALDSVTALVEAGLQHAVCTGKEASDLLSLYLPKEPSRSLLSRYSKARFPILRAYSLRAALEGRVLDLRDLAHPELRAEMEKNNQHSTSSDLREFQEDIGALLPWHRLWVATLLGHVNVLSLDSEIQATYDVSKSVTRSYHHDDSHTSNETALLWYSTLHRLNKIDGSSLACFLQWKGTLKRPLFTPTLTALARLCGQKEESKAMALGLALESFNLTKNERTDAGSKSEGYIDIARAILNVSRSEAKAYFDEAVEVASKIGDENLSRWDAILDLADRAAKKVRPAPEVAYHFSRCTELTYEYVVRDKHFDWHGTIEALCGLCPSSSLAIMSRWRDRDFGWSERIFPVAIERLIEQGDLPALDAAPLISFRAQWNSDQLFGNVLKACGTPVEKEHAAGYLYRYMQFGDEDFSKLRTVAADQSIDIKGLENVIAFKESEKRAKAKSENWNNGNFATPQPEHIRLWDDVFAGADLKSAGGLKDSYANFKSWDPPGFFEHFIKEVINRIPAGFESTFIEAFGNNPEFNLFNFRDLLEQVPETWKGRPAIMRALAKLIRVFCRRYCMKISKNRHYEVLPFETASKLSGMGKRDIAEIILEAIGETPDRADANRLFSLIGLLTIMMSDDDALEALMFGLNLFTPILEDKDGDGPWSTRLLPPANIKISLAGYLWASLASPETALRWEGAHATLGLAALGRKEVLGHLFDFAIKRISEPFVDKRLTFYTLHALQWFLIGIARATEEYSPAIAPFANQLIDWALNDQPHVLIRRLAARAVLGLLRSGVLTDRENLKERLSSINLTSLPIVRSKTYSRISPKKKQASSDIGNDRFYFGIDFGPYWYDPLGRVFALPSTDIEIEAFKVIRTDFNLDLTGSWDEDERGRRNIYKNDEIHHSHGSYPRSDTLQFYIAYHAMLVVAGKLLAAVPVHSDPEDGEKDEFNYWLDRHDLSRRDGRWLWDRRDPAPLERPTWKDRPKVENKWRTITAEDFEEVLHVNESISVWGYWTMADSDHEQSVRVSSALVSSDKSLALLQALGTAENPHDYAIPAANSDMEINQSGFDFKGWITVSDRDRELDGLDRWAGGVRYPSPMPAEYIVKSMELTTDSDTRFWRNESETVVITSQVWGHHDEAKRHERSNPECGSRLQASMEFLFAVLDEFQLDMIIEVQIDRRRRFRSYEKWSGEDDKERVSSQTKLYLLGRDGKIRTF
jgi:hypothetical protein